MTKYNFVLKKFKAKQVFLWLVSVFNASMAIKQGFENPHVLEINS